MIETPLLGGLNLIEILTRGFFPKYKQPHLWDFISSAAFPTGTIVDDVETISCPDLLFLPLL